MKRIMYISSATRPLSPEEIEEIAQKSVANNARDGVTGVLLSAQEFFFQILEGEPFKVDEVFQRIRKDPRHQDVLILKVEHEIKERLFGQWSMKTVRLDANGDLLIKAIRIMLENITESHRIIERYTQPVVLNFLTEGINPLTVPVQKKESVVLFGDIVAFSHLSTLYPVEEVTDLVNLFLNLGSAAIVRHGGEVTKYVGDCIVAHFEADGADQAIEASLEILKTLQELRGKAGSCRLQRFLYCGLGVSKGPVIQGNIGSSTKLDYTVLGDTVNQAARLEGITRAIGKALALGDTVKTASLKSWPFVAAGEFTLKGQVAPREIYTIDDPAVNDFMDFDGIVQIASDSCSPFLKT